MSTSYYFVETELKGNRIGYLQMKSPSAQGTTLLLKEDTRNQIKGGILVKEEEWPEDYGTGKRVLGETSRSWGSQVLSTRTKEQGSQIKLEKFLHSPTRSFQGLGETMLKQKPQGHGHFLICIPHVLAQWPLTLDQPSFDTR